MPRLTVNDLTTIKKEILREGGKRVKAIVHMGTCGIASGAGKVHTALVNAMKAAGVDDVAVTTSGCIGICSKEPLVTIAIAGRESITYHSMDEAKVRQIFERHIRGGEVQGEFALVKGLVEHGRSSHQGPVIEAGIPSLDEIPFFSKQELRVLRNRGLIDPERIEAYVARDGYRGAAKALLEMTPEGIISEVKKAGLQGRGGRRIPHRAKVAVCVPSAGSGEVCPVQRRRRGPRAPLWTEASWRETPMPSWKG